MITKGNICDFSFYVTAFDSRNKYAEYGTASQELSLEQAKSEFAKRCAENPISVNTMLGVDFTTDRKDLEPMGMGAADLLQCINGHLRLSEDYKLSQALMQEKLISVNAIAMLQREAVRLQRISDNATAKCATLISENAQSVCRDPAKTEQFIKELADAYGIERCKGIIANELLGSYGKAGEETVEYLNDAFNGEYDSRFAVFASAEQLEELAKATKQVEASLTETESKLHDSGLVYGDSNSIRERSADLKSEIAHHNRLEDEGLVSDDQLSL